LTGRNADRLRAAAADVGALHTAAFDANNAEDLEHFFRTIPEPVDHVLVTAGRPSYGPLLEMSVADVARRASADMPCLDCRSRETPKPKMRSGGTLILIGGTGGRRIDQRLGIISAATATLPPLTAATRTRTRPHPRQF